MNKPDKRASLDVSTKPGEATAVSVPVAAGLSPLSLAMFLPTSSQNFSS